MEGKRILIKALRLEKYFRAYNVLGSQKDEAFRKFEQVWGTAMANHFLSKYDDAESLIWALDSNNLELFIKNF